MGRCGVRPGRAPDAQKENAKGDKPFFLCYWYHGPNAAGVHRLGRDSNSSIANTDGDGLQKIDERLGEVFKLLKDEGIDENTLVVVLYKDPREENGLMAQFLWAWEPFDSMKARHFKLMEEYPNTPTRSDKPFGGIDIMSESN